MMKAPNSAPARAASRRLASICPPRPRLAPGSFAITLTISTRPPVYGSPCAHEATPVRADMDDRASLEGPGSPAGARGRAARVSRRRVRARASVAKRQRREADHSRLLPRGGNSPAPNPTPTVQRRSTVEKRGRNRWLANAEPDQGGAILRRRAVAHQLGAGAAVAEGVDARGPRRGRLRPAGQGRCSGGWRRTRPQTELAESEERDPPTGPARRQLRALGTSPPAVRHPAGVAGPWALLRRYRRPLAEPLRLGAGSDRLGPDLAPSPALLAMALDLARELLLAQVDRVP
jgi:hypothetical protein